MSAGHSLLVDTQRSIEGDSDTRKKILDLF